MRLPILTSVLVLCLVIAYATHKNKEAAHREREEFWEKERAANNTRRKSLDSLSYITIPVEALPIDLYNEDNIIAESVNTIVELSKSPIVNLTGISNTDLKLEYGAPNIDLLSAYDQRYTTLARTLQTWGNRLYELGDEASAILVLEFAISTKTDISGTYRLLSDIYVKNKAASSIEKLISTAKEINTPLKESILASLYDALESASL